MPALVSALKRVDLPTFGRPTMPHLMPIALRSLGVCRRFIASFMSPATASGSTPMASSMARSIEASSSLPGRPSTQGVTRSLWPGMADADAQAVELAVAEHLHDVAQAVLAAVAAVELHARGAGRQVQLVVRHQALFGLDLPVAQRRPEGPAR
jgi:hypothetical protein